MEHSKLNWHLLKNNQCPKCRSIIESLPDAMIYRCSSILCDFKISPEKFENIVGKLYRNKLEVPMYRNGEEVEDLQKHKWPECNFCGGEHNPQINCEGFA